MALKPIDFARAVQTAIEGTFGAAVDVLMADGSRHRSTRPAGLELDGVTIEQRNGNIGLAIVFHQMDRPRIKYGYRVSDLGSYASEAAGEVTPSFDGRELAEVTARIVVSGIEEIHESADLGLPDGDEDTVTWLD